MSSSDGHRSRDVATLSRLHPLLHERILVGREPRTATSQWCCRASISAARHCHKRRGLLARRRRLPHGQRFLSSFASLKVPRCKPYSDSRAPHDRVHLTHARDHRRNQVCGSDAGGEKSELPIQAVAMTAHDPGQRLSACLSVPCASTGSYESHLCASSTVSTPHDSDRGTQYTSIRHTERIAAAGVERSVGRVGDSYDNALAETINGLYKNEVIYRRGPWRTSTPSSTRRWSGSTGSTTAVCSRHSATCFVVASWSPNVMVCERDLWLFQHYELRTSSQIHGPTRI